MNLIRLLLKIHLRSLFLLLAITPHALWASDHSSKSSTAASNQVIPEDLIELREDLSSPSTQAATLLTNTPSASSKPEVLNPSAIPLTTSYLVSHIELRGLVVLKEETLMDIITLKTNTEINQKAIARQIKALFETDWFEHIQAKYDPDSETLIFEIIERKSIVNITVSESSLFKKEEFLKILASLGLGEGKILSRNMLNIVRTEIQTLYDNQGRYGTIIDYEVKEINEQNVEIHFEIQETSVMTIQSISFIGNVNFSDTILKSLMQTSDINPITWLTGTNKYNKEKIMADLESIRSFYLNQGFMRFNISSIEVKVSPDYQHLYLFIYLKEGDQYKVNEININGRHAISTEKALEALYIEKGSYYNESLIQNNIDEFQSEISNIGYLNTKIINENKINDDNKTVDINFVVDAGESYMVRHIHFKGNYRTKDAALRRELRQAEGTIASKSLLELSKSRILRLGFFEQVTYEVVYLPNKSKWVDIVYNITEISNSSISGQINYSNIYGASVAFNYKHDNILGSGDKIDLYFDFNYSMSDLSLSYTQPYFKDSNINLSYSIFFQKTDLERADITTYKLDNTGASVGLSYPLTEYQTIGYNVDFLNTNIDYGKDSIDSVKDFVDLYGNNYNDILLTARHVYSSLDSGYLPTSGYNQRASLRLSAPAISSLYYYEARLRSAFYQPVDPDKNLVWYTMAELYYGGTYAGTEAFPFYRHQYIGGISTLRGFRTASVGPKEKNADGDLVNAGGNTFVLLQNNIIFRIPGVPNNLRTMFFVDAGALYNINCSHYTNCKGQVDFSDFSASTGVALTFYSPVGPLSFSYALPLKKGPNDIVENFQFGLGYNF